MLVSLEGIDGAGKTTIARLVAERSAGLVKFQSRRAVESQSAYANTIAEKLAGVLWGSGDSCEVSPTFWLYAQAAWYVLVGENRASGLGIALIDGWYYKFLARLQFQGFSIESLEAVFKQVPHPNQVILLDVDPAIAWNRKNFRPLETGLHMTENLDGQKGFLVYQNGTIEILRQMSKRFGWQTLVIGADETVEKTAARVADLVTALSKNAF